MLPAAMTVRPDRPLFPASLCMPKKERSVEHPSLLSEGQGMSLTIGCVSEQIPRRSGKAERADIRARAVACVVLGFALCQFHIPRFR